MAKKKETIKIEAFLLIVLAIIGFVFGYGSDLYKDTKAFIKDVFHDEGKVVETLDKVNVKVYFIDVGEADSILIDSNGKYTNSWFKRYRAKRQLELYGKTTQAELQKEDEGNTRELSDLIYAGLERYDSLEDNDKKIFNYTLYIYKEKVMVFIMENKNMVI